MEVTFKNKWGDVVSFEDTPEMRNRVFDYLLENFFKKYEEFSGEGIMQADDPQIYAPQVLSDIADDIIQFKVDYGDEDV